MLCLLAVRKAVRRDEVVDMLWRGVDEDKARNAFRQALHRLRAAVGDEVLPQDRERLRLFPSDRLTIDLERFEAAVAAGQLEKALEYSAGDFLEQASLGEPPFDMWVEQERTRLRARTAQILTEATAAASAQGRTADAVALSRRLMTVAPLESASAQLAATTLIAAGRREEARELLKRFATTLDAEVGLPLPAELQSMLSRLEKQKAPADSTQRLAQSSLHFTLPFAGREAELSQLVTLCRTTAEESGGFALVKGNTGLGKTRLLNELAAHLKSLGRITVLHGREHIAGVQLPYAVFADALRPLVRARGVGGASRHLLAEAARLLPELRDEMELPVVTDVEDEAGRLRFFEGVAALVDAAAFERPVVLIVDDVHLAGPSTLELLSYLCARLARSAVTFVLALRPDDAPASMLTRLEAIAHADSQTHPGRSLSLQLAPLSADATQAATTGLIADAAARQQVIARSEGIPARLAELARRVARGDPLPSTALGLREIAVDRVARLSSLQRRLLFVVALFGRSVSRSVAGAAAHLPTAAVDDAIGALAAEGLLARNADDAIEIDDATAATALELAGPSTRSFLSGWIVDELAARGAAPAELARFSAAAGRSRQAFEQSRLAAFAALTLGALPEAAHHLKVARSFASTREEISSVESMLVAIGEGHKQIAAVLARETSAPPTATRPVAPRRTTPASRIEALFPNWRLLLGAAIATLIITAVVLADKQTGSVAVAGLASGDTLLVAEDADPSVLGVITGDMSRGFRVSQRRSALPPSPAWVDSLPRNWSNPLTAPRTQRVAVHRVTQTGSDLFIISSDRRDTVGLVENGGDARALAWSPDGRWLLASVSQGEGSFDAHLYAFSGNGGPGERLPIDVTPTRTVMQALWSPEGTHIAWVARVGAERQLEVFVSDADGSNTRNVSRDPADDQHIAWSPDGRLLAFTSMRDANAELYAYSLVEKRLWRLTTHVAQDDAAQFSADGRLVAFESTRGGNAAVYVMPALGGDVAKIESPRPLSIVRWTGRPQRYLDRVYIEQSGRLRFGDSTKLRLLALDQFDEPMNAVSPEWQLLDSLLVRPLANSEAGELRIASRGQGVARIIARVGGWRADTALIALGSGRLSLLPSGGSSGVWRPLGTPRPALGGSVITLVSDREWDSGVLSRNPVPLLPGLVVETALQLPIGDSRDAAASAAVSLVAPEDSSTIDFDAPQFLRFASVSWNAEAGRFFYAVGREFFSESAASVVAGKASLSVQLRIESDSTVSFNVAGTQRWRSSLRILAPSQSARAQIWISSRATGARARLLNANVRLDPLGAISSP